MSHNLEVDPMTMDKINMAHVKKYVSLYYKCVVAQKNQHGQLYKKTPHQKL